MRRTLLPILVPALLLLAACDARRDYPPGLTDVDLWSGPAIRPDTEVPDQYPHGTTREQAGSGAYGHDGDHEADDHGGGDDH